MIISLFSIKLPECTTNEEIKKLQFENPNLDPYYIASCAISERKSLFEQCYKQYEPYGDTNFLKEITTRFHQRTWEMYLGSLCIINGKKLNKHRTNNQADLQVINNTNLTHIECIAVTHGDKNNPDAVPKMNISESFKNIIVSDVPEEKILLRITQALNDKLKQYQERIISKRILENESYIIAVNTGEIGHPEHLPRILKAVFGVGYLTLRMRQNGLPVVNPPSFWNRRETVARTNKQNIDMTFFEKEESKGISAVIYSNSAVLHHLVNSKDEVIIVHNPIATNPLSFDKFNFLTQHYVDKTTGDIVKLTPQKIN